VTCSSPHPSRSAASCARSAEHAYYTDWWDHGAGNKPGWETFDLLELRQILERGLNPSDQRAVAGLSMGGFGVMSYAGRQPGFFRAAASFSGVLNTLQPTVAPLFPGLYATWVLQAFLAPLGYDPLSLFGDPVAQRDVWSAHNPADLVANLRGTKLFVSCGSGHVGPLDPPGTDPPGLLVQLEAALLLQNQEFIRRAIALGLDLTTDLYGPGTHTWPYWARELDKAFPLLIEAIGAM
jgi:diacylglycerol O-acyltransferase/trehalose O-mycolyltransferase